MAAGGAQAMEEAPAATAAQLVEAMEGASAVTLPSALELLAFEIERVGGGSYSTISTYNIR
uniref:Uncharacterized protein n=1 Tax=Oryza glumipatula TaxID=40148 RepID=A0A0D9ZBE0_9ORYZ